MVEIAEKSRLSEIIQVWRPPILYLLLGMILGPFVTSWLGWQVNLNIITGTTNTAVDEAIVAYRAGLCVQRARSDPEAAGAVLADDSTRRKLAEKWAALPGEVPDLAVIIECSSRLAKL